MASPPLGSRGLRWLPAVTAVALGCSEPPPLRPPGPGAVVPTGTQPPAAQAIQLGALPLALDERGVPRLLVGDPAMPALQAAGATELARRHVERLAPAWGVAEAAVPALVAAGEIAWPGATIVRLRQVVDGVPIAEAEGGELRVMVRADGALVAAGGSLVAATTPHPGPAGFAFVATGGGALDEPGSAGRGSAPEWERGVIDEDAVAVARAVSALYQTGFAADALVPSRRAADGSRLLAGRSGQITVARARARKAWVPNGGRLIAAWVVEAYSDAAGSTGGDAYRTVVAADDGRVVKRTNLTADAVFRYRVFAETAGERHPFDGPLVDVSPDPSDQPGTTPYPVYLLPDLVSVDGLNHPAGQADPDPWLAASQSETIGNNVDAYTDINPPDGLSAGDFRATATATGTFDRSYDTAAAPTSSQGQQMAAITQLFYLNNWLHDFWYDAGFTEAAGNAQTANLGRGGEDGDALLAEAQDNANDGSRNNANMTTPSDGLAPRMQVFVWDGGDDRSLAISGRTPATGPAAFGALHVTVTAAVALAVDGSAPINDGCSALTVPVTGKLVLVDRGGCTIKTKVRNIQSAGGAGAIVADSAPALFPPSLADDPAITTPITIGVVSVLQSEGAAIKADLAAGPVSATLHRNALPDLDGALDATVIAHENGHYVHHRLTSCTTALCRAMSEGWGDFAALLVISRAGDDFSGAFPIAVYSTRSFPDPVYYGIRRAPYSADPAINPLSFRHMAADEPLPPPPFNAGDPRNNAEVHNAGEVWAAMLWQGYAALQQQPGASFDDVRLRMRQYVVAGLLLAPSNATPTETRDAVLMAALALHPADHDVLAAAYARRGFGSCAVSPARDSADFTGIVESAELKGRLAVGAPVMQLTQSCDQDDVLDGGETAQISVAVANAGPLAITGVTATLTTSAPGIRITEPSIAIGTLGPYTSAPVRFAVELADDAVAVPRAASFTVQVTADASCTAVAQAQLAVRLDSDDVPASSATDSFDASSTVWTASDGLWSHLHRTPLAGTFAGSDIDGPSDTSLVSPPLTAGPGPLTLRFTQRFSFESSGSTAFDGGVIEYSTDEGASWADISALTDPGYNVTLAGSPASSGNPLSGRRAYGRTSAGYPATVTIALPLGTALAGQTFRLRFRIGSDVTLGAPGWEIDDVALSGIVGTPFPSVVPDGSSCDPTGDAGVPVDGGGPDALAPDAPGPGAPTDAGTSKPDATPPFPGPDGGTASGGGGAGCRAGGPGALGPAWFLIGFAVLLRRRRR